jgi:hypothetical protein
LTATRHRHTPVSQRLQIHLQPAVILNETKKDHYSRHMLTEWRGQSSRRLSVLFRPLCWLPGLLVYFESLWIVEKPWCENEGNRYL